MAAIISQQNGPGFFLEWNDRRPTRVHTMMNYCLFVVKVHTLPNSTVRISNGQLVNMDIKLSVPTDNRDSTGAVIYRQVDAKDMPYYIHYPVSERLHQVSETCGLIHCDDFWFKWPGTFKLEISLSLEGPVFLGQCTLAPFEVTMSDQPGNMESDNWEESILLELMKAPFSPASKQLSETEEDGTISTLSIWTYNQAISLIRILSSLPEKASFANFGYEDTILITLILGQAYIETLLQIYALILLLLPSGRTTYVYPLSSRDSTASFNPSDWIVLNEPFPDLFVKISIREGCNERFTGDEPIHLDNIILKIYDPEKKFDCHTEPDSAGYREIYGLGVANHATRKKDYTAELPGKEVTIRVQNFCFLQEARYKVAFNVSLGNVHLGTTQEQFVHPRKSVRPVEEPEEVVDPI
ncbi:hypothetical protein T310_9944 [Rasamsonia emersonii CBS 393.64]|uniref:Uncharacterized protein n=1 Tax=Rasamsonia emersonii (strain ATCC 16479 / CBS 393.64 / IMI 116815) TaxID=1408163 RepID=A0A0F4YFS3_RASE3|nr:hypothetical protein T310_9944 [Rasamsonia emersonii CBS 393.64]KKA16468.1 hypothetical protein T310_9944 [Rasamsonia emersonii CBS 393.64]